MVRCIGLMSGTSLDGVDGVLVDFHADPAAGFEVLAHGHSPLPAPLRDELLALNRPGDNELHRAALAANALMEVYAATVRQLLDAAGVDPASVAAIGAHGQTVRHRPGEFDGIGYTLQLMNGALLAERSRIDVVCDFRSADVCAGGQGAPLVPAFHAAAFARPDADVAVLNLGGIANLTLLGHDGRVSGFDTGPGNLLMDGWIGRHLGQPYDADGQWAASGQVQQALLRTLLAEPYFGRPPPKSTGRDLFDLAWIDRQLVALAPQPAPVDVMATLAELTAQSVAQALRLEAPDTRHLLLAGGGSRNRHLVHRLQAALPGVELRVSASVGIEPEQVEAIAFAWLAQAHLERRPANLPGVTGARQPRVLGARYPAGRI